MEEVTPVLYGHHLHYLDQSACHTCTRENDVFTSLTRDGEHVLEAKLYKLDSYKKYYRRWPFDGKAAVLPLESYNEPSLANPLDQIIADEAVEAFKADLTDKQLEVVNMRAEGYKPREIAKKQGSRTSNKVRWHLFVARNKLKDRTEVS